MTLPKSKVPFRVWVNQPSKLQDYHHLHGQQFIAVHDYDNTYRIYFLNGSVISQQITEDALVPGWKYLI